MSSGLGINVDPSGADDAAAVKASGAQWVRFPLRRTQDTLGIVKRYQAVGLKVLLCCDTETEKGFASSTAAAIEYRTRVGFLAQAIQIGPNEFDQVGSTSSTTSEEQTFETMSAWAAVWRPTSALLVGPNLASGQPDRWTKRLAALVKVCALSRYPSIESGGPARMGDGIYGPSGYRRFGNDVWITEFPIWTADYITAALAHSDYPPIAYDWHSWHQDDQAYWHDGLLDIAGQPTWRLDAFKEKAREITMAMTADETKRLADAEERNELAIDLAARMLTGKWKGGADSAEALIRAISPDKYGDEAPGGPLVAVDFPK